MNEKIWVEKELRECDEKTRKIICDEVCHPEKEIVLLHDVLFDYDSPICVDCYKKLKAKQPEDWTKVESK